MPVWELKLTRGKPIEGVSLEDFKVYKKYLYTDTGLVGRWAVAVKVAYPKDKKPPKVLKFRVEVINDE